MVHESCPRRGRDPTRWGGGGLPKSMIRRIGRTVRSGRKHLMMPAASAPSLASLACRGAGVLHSCIAQYRPPITRYDGEVLQRHGCGSCCIALAHNPLSCKAPVPMPRYFRQLEPHHCYKAAKEIIEEFPPPSPWPHDLPCLVTRP
jgi:hypothetical protein